MRVADEIGKIPPAPKAGRVATLGVFDGVHRGHLAILGEVVGQAREIGGEAAVLTFRNHPRAMLLGKGPPSILSVEQRLARFEKVGIDLAVALEFDAKLRDTTAEEFLDGLLGRAIGARALVLGDDARFGKDRRGNAAFARARGWKVTEVSQVSVGGARASSGAVRAAIAEGRLEDAAALLGRSPTLYGRVVRGEGRGRSLGFATANLELLHDLEPPRGVYAGSVVIDGERRAAVVNLGIRPTFAEGRKTVEAHVPGWTGDLYGRLLEVELLAKIRDEMRFDSPGALAAQIAADTAKAIAIATATRGD